MGNEDAPPPYSAQPGAAAQSDSKQDPSHPGPSPPTPPPDYTRYAGPVQPPGVLGNVKYKFPSLFCLYYSGGFLGRTYSIGPHRNEPLYAVSIHSGFSSSRPPLVLHTGPDANTCPMMACLNFRTFSSTVNMTIPPLPKIQLLGSGMLRRTYTFTMDVGLGNGMQAETFEWRHSRGAAVDALAGDFDGYKLVRLKRGPPPGMPAEARHDPGRFATSDGLEVVAAWSDARLSFSKQAKFALVGTGETGLLGEQWTVAAVLSALAIWEIQRRNNGTSDA